jgi:CRP-like cAMP-binding protein
MSVLHNPNEAFQNHLLASLNAEEFSRLKPGLTMLSLSGGDVIYESGEQIEYVYFPTTAIISLLCIMGDGATGEVGVVGHEGLVGGAYFMGSEATPIQTVVQSAGRAVRVNAKHLQAEFVRHGRFQRLLLRYTQAMMTQISQTAVCNRMHSIDQRLCRRLLLSRDRLQSNRLTMTHELMANILGVRRESVTHAAKQLRDAGLITYARGDIRILDRRGLEASVCECYHVVKNEYGRLLGKTLVLN